MKKVNVSILASFVIATLLLSSCGGLNKMVKMAPEVRYDVTPKVLELHGDSVETTVKVTFPTKFFQKKATLEITPVVKYDGGEQAFKSLTLQGESVQDNNQVVSFTSGGTFTVSSKVAFVEGMRQADLVVRVKATIGDDTGELPEKKIADGTMASALLIEDDAKAIAADDNFVRVTTQKEGADIHFVINRATIRGKELRKEDINKLKEFVKNNASKENVEFKGVEISAYASPDGPLDLNDNLSHKRLNSAKSYLERELKREKIDGLEEEGFISTQTTAEDWEGFKELVQGSEIEDKELILRVLSMYSDPVVREKEIKNIAAAYEELKTDILPELRRSKMFVNLAVIGYSDDELKELATSNPDTLNVEELMYAATLFTDNATKLQVYQAVANQFPDDWRGHNNVAFISIKMGNLDAAKAALEEAKKVDATNTKVLNNLGVVALKQGDVDAAKEFFDAAAGAGNQVSYNQAIIAAEMGNYENALNLFSSSKYNTFNFALVKMLNYSNTNNNDVFDAALGILKKVEDQEASNVYYLKAILGARKQDKDLMFNNLRTAVEKDAKWADYAKKDIEFAQYKSDDTFKSIVG